MTLHQTTLPSLLTLPSPPPALRTFLTLQNLATRSHTLLASLSIASFVAAYIISPHGHRHPYLIYCTLGIGMGWGGLDLWLDKFWLDYDRRKENEARKIMVKDGDRDGGEGVNGEVVRGVMEGWREREGWRGGIWGFTAGLAILGIWGDGA